ncbi:MAG: hypothetical protein JO314_14060 [Acidobacteria bacterium]|nr:hypothetical protein [Acidobacteriota bacterium]
MSESEAKGRSCREALGKIFDGFEKARKLGLNCASESDLFKAEILEQKRRRRPFLIIRPSPDQPVVSFFRRSGLPILIARNVTQKKGFVAGPLPDDVQVVLFCERLDKAIPSGAFTQPISVEQDGFRPIAGTADFAPLQDANGTFHYREWITAPWGMMASM